MRRLSKQISTLPRPVLLGGGAFVAVTLTFLFGVPYLLDGVRHGQVLAQKIANASGQQVRIEGGVQVSLLPTPQMVLNNVLLISRDGTSILMQLPQIRINTSYAALLSGTGTLEEVHLVNPTLNLARDPARNLWSWYPDVALAASLSTQELEISNGRILLQNGTTQEAIEQLSGRFILRGGDRHLDSQINGQWRKQALSLEAYIGRPDAQGLSYVMAQGQIGAAQSQLKFEGKWPLVPVVGVSGTAQGVAELQVTAQELAKLWGVANEIGVLPAEAMVHALSADPGMADPLSLKSDVQQVEGGVELTNMALQLGDMDVRGRLRYSTVPQRSISAALRLNQFVVEDWPSVLALGGAANLSFPPDMLAALDVAITALSYGELTAQNVQLKAGLKQNILSLSEASATLAAGSRVVASGALQGAVAMQGADGQVVQTSPAAVEGKITFDSTQLRDFFAAQQWPVPPEVKDDALRQLNIQAEFRGAWPHPALSGVEAKLDGASLKGRITPRAGSSEVDANLEVSQLDPSRYGFGFSVPSWLWQLPQGAWNLSFKDFRLGGQYVERANLAARLMPDVLAIQSLDISGWLNSHLTLAGSVGRKESALGTTLTTTVQTEDIAMLSGALSALPPLMPALLAEHLSGPAVVSVRHVDEGDGQYSRLINVTQAQDARINLALEGSAEALNGWKLRVQYPEGTSLLTGVNPSWVKASAGSLGQVDVYAEGMRGQSGLWMMRNMQGRIGQTELTGGELSLLPGWPATLRGRLAFELLDLDSLSAVIENNSYGLIWAGSVATTARNLTLMGQKLQDVSATLSQQSQQLSVEALTAKLNGGTVSAAGKITLGATMALEGTLDLAGVDLDLAAGPRYGLTGPLNVHLEGQAAGAGAVGLLSSLSAQGDFSFDEGSVRGIDFTALSRAVRDFSRNLSGDSVAQQTALNEQLPNWLARSGKANLQSFGGDFVIEDGQMRIPRLLFKTKDITGQMSGMVDLRGPRLDGKVMLDFDEATGSQGTLLALQLTGSLSDIQVGPDQEAATALVLPEPPEGAVPRDTGGKAKVAASLPLNADVDPAAEEEVSASKKKKLSAATPKVKEKAESDYVEPMRNIRPAAEGEEDVADMEATPAPQSLEALQAEAMEAEMEEPAPPTIRNLGSGAPSIRNNNEKPKAVAPAAKSQNSGSSKIPPPPSIQDMLKALPQLSGAATGVPPAANTAPLTKPSATAAAAPKPATPSQPVVTRNQDGSVQTRYGNLVIVAPEGEAAVGIAPAAGAAAKQAPAAPAASSEAMPKPIFTPVE